MIRNHSSYRAFSLFFSEDDMASSLTKKTKSGRFTNTLTRSFPEIFLSVYNLGYLERGKDRAALFIEREFFEVKGGSLLKVRDGLFDG